jgi:hypothetical protein
MALELIPLGRLRVWAALDRVIQGAGPISGRTLSVFQRVLWETDKFTLDTASGSGAYVMGEDVAQIDVKVAFRDAEGTAIFLDYLTRASMPLLSAGKAPGYMTGHVDVADSATKYAWLNRTQIVGKGMVTFDPVTLDYEVFVLK